MSAICKLTVFLSPPVTVSGLYINVYNGDPMYKNNLSQYTLINWGGEYMLM